MSGLRVVVTASLKHAERLKSLGAEVVFDYKDPDVARKIREYTAGTLKSGGICELMGNDLNIIIAALSNEGGVLSGITPNFIKKTALENINENVNIVISLAYTTFGKASHILRSSSCRSTISVQPIESPMVFPSYPEHFTASTRYWKLISRLLEEGKIQLVPTRVFGGLESVGDGLKEMREGRVRKFRLAVIARSPSFGTDQRRENHLQGFVDLQSQLCVHCFARTTCIPFCSKRKGARMTLVSGAHRLEPQCPHFAQCLNRSNLA